MSEVGIGLLLPAQTVQISGCGYGSSRVCLGYPYRGAPRRIRIICLPCLLLVDEFDSDVLSWYLNTGFARPWTCLEHC